MSTTSPPAQKPRPSAWSIRMMRTSGSSRHSISARGHVADHLAIEAVQRLRPVEAKAAGEAFLGGQHVGLSRRSSSSRHHRVAAGRGLDPVRDGCGRRPACSSRGRSAIWSRSATSCLRGGLRWRASPRRSPAAGLAGPEAMLVGGGRVDHAGIVARAAEDEVGADVARAAIDRFPGRDMVVLRARSTSIGVLIAARSIGTPPTSNPAGSLSLLLSSRSRL